MIVYYHRISQQEIYGKFLVKNFPREIRVKFELRF